MTFQQWLDRLREELNKRRLPSRYSARLIEELTQHFTDVQMENQIMDAHEYVDDILGTPESLALVAQTTFANRTCAARYRWQSVLGLVTLATVLVVLVGWMRSLWNEDEFQFPNNPRTTYFISSANGSIFCSRFINKNFATPLIPVSAGISYFSQPVPDESIEEQIQNSGFKTISFADWAGFCNCQVEFDSKPIFCEAHFLAVPYWFIASSLALLSALLLCVKPGAKVKGVRAASADEFQLHRIAVNLC